MKETAKDLAAILSTPANRTCADCQRTLLDASDVFASFQNRQKSDCLNFQRNHVRMAPPGSSSHAPFRNNHEVPAKRYNLAHGVLVCASCAAAHRLLGDSFCTVRPVYDDKEWTREELDLLIGNSHASSILEHALTRKRPRQDSNMAERLNWVRAKYQALAFVLPAGPLSNRSWKKIASGTMQWSDWTLHQQQHTIDANQLHTSARLELPNRLVDYFCVVTPGTGLDPQACPKEIQSVEDYCLSAVVRDVFSAKDNEDDFPTHVASFCFPNGCRVEEGTPRPPSFFTMALTLGTGERLYGCCLTVYDESRDVSWLRKIVENSRPDDPLLECLDGDKPVLHVPKCLVLLSHYEFFDVGRKFLRQLYRISMVPSPLPIERFICNFCAEVPLPPAGRIAVVAGFTNDEQWRIERPPPNRLPLANFSFQPLFACLCTPHVLIIWATLLKEGRLVVHSKHAALLGPVTQALVSLMFPLQWQGLYIPVVPQHMMIDLVEAPVPFLVGCTCELPYVPEGVTVADLDTDTLTLTDRMPAVPEKQGAKLKHRVWPLANAVYLPDKQTLKYEHGAPRVREAYAQTVDHYVATWKEDHGKRRDTLASVNRAYRSSDLMTPVKGFLSEQGHMVSSPIKTKVSTPQKTWRDRLQPKEMAKPSTNEKDDLLSVNDVRIFSCGLSADFSLQPPGFDTDAIRNAFLQFFVSLFRDYREFVGKDSKFESDKFVNFLNISERNQQYVLDLLQTQMFDSFVQESVLPDDPVVRFFDDTIVAKKNRSKKQAIAHIGRKKQETAFLDDKSFEITETFSPLSPSKWGIPDNAAEYQYGSFPVLESSLFGKIRKPRPWPRTKEETKLFLRRMKRSSRSLLRKKEKEVLAKMMGQAPGRRKVARPPGIKPGVPTLDEALEDLSAPYNPDAHSQNEICEDLKLMSAEEVVGCARKRTFILIEVITRFQRVFREWLLKKKDDAAYKQVRSIIRSYGKTEKAVLSAATRIQSMARRSTARSRLIAERNASTSISSWRRALCVRLAYLLLIQSVRALQGLFRGVLLRRTLQTVLTGRLDMYKLCLSTLWKLECTSLCFRTTFWEHLSDPSILSDALVVEEINRVSKSVGINTSDVAISEIDIQSDDFTIRLADSIGLPSQHYLRVRKVVFEKEKDAPSTGSSSTREMSERQQIYERLASGRFMSTEDVGKELDVFHISNKEKHKKAALSKAIWVEGSMAAASVSFMLRLFPELKAGSDIAFMETSKKGRQRIQASGMVLPLRSPMLGKDRFIDLIRRDNAYVASCRLQSKVFSFENHHKTWLASRVDSAMRTRRTGSASQTRLLLMKSLFQEGRVEYPGANFWE